MSDPSTFFDRLGRRIHAAVIEAEETLTEALTPEPHYPDRVGQLNQIRATAEQQVLAQMLPGPEQDEPTTPETTGT